ncbi:hypothetical protein STEG23_029720 [Scotinomys teguina]
MLMGLTHMEPGSVVDAPMHRALVNQTLALKTSLFAGVAYMNITLGVPLIKDILHTSKAISFFSVWSQGFSV